MEEIYKDPKTGKEYVFTGKCKQCLTCCIYVNVLYQRTPEFDEWAKARELEIIQQTEHHTEVRFKNPCPQLTSAYKHFKCRIHKNKPVACRDFPRNMIIPWLNMGLDVNKSTSIKTCGFRLKEK